MTLTQEQIRTAARAARAFPPDHGYEWARTVDGVLLH
jgi:hypothetical protein